MLDTRLSDARSPRGGFLGVLLGVCLTACGGNGGDEPPAAASELAAPRDTSRARRHDRQLRPARPARPTHAVAHRERLAGLGVVDDAALAAAIREGVLDDRMDEVTAAIRASLVDELSVSHPGYVDDPVI